MPNLDPLFISEIKKHIECNISSTHLEKYNLNKIYTSLTDLKQDILIYYKEELDFNHRQCSLHLEIALEDMDSFYTTHSNYIIQYVENYITMYQSFLNFIKIQVTLSTQKIVPLFLKKEFIYENVFKLRDYFCTMLQYYLVQIYISLTSTEQNTDSEHDHTNLIHFNTLVKERLLRISIF